MKLLIGESVTSDDREHRGVKTPEILAISRTATQSTTPPIPAPARSDIGPVAIMGWIVTGATFALSPGRNPGSGQLFKLIAVSVRTLTILVAENPTAFSSRLFRPTRRRSRREGVVSR